MLAQLGEHLPCMQGVRGSIPLRSTIVREDMFLGLLGSLGREIPLRTPPRFRAWRERNKSEETQWGTTGSLATCSLRGRQIFPYLTHFLFQRKCRAKATNLRSQGRAPGETLAVSLGVVPERLLVVTRGGGPPTSRADSSAGRAVALQATGRRFDPCSAHHP